MRVALIDNMNNCYFALGRYLRDQGMDVHLYTISGSSDHFKPECDTFEDVSLMDWIHEFPSRTWVRSWLSTPWRRKLGLFKSYDVIVASGYSLAFLKREDIQVDIFVAYGGDIFLMPFRSYNPACKLQSLLKAVTSITHYQRRAIQEAALVIADTSFGPIKRAVDRLAITPLEIGLPMFYNKETGDHVSQRWGFLKKHDFVIFNHSRQSWVSNPFGLCDFDLYGGDKRNDRLIRAFKMFLDITAFKDPVLILFEYGEDIEDSKSLIEGLGIDSNVVWMPTMGRKHLMQGLKLASLGFDMARENLLGVGCTTYELLAAGVPAMTYTNGAIDNPDSFYYRAPFIDVLTEENILDVLIDYERCPEKYYKIGRESIAWFNVHLGEGLAARYYDMICGIAKEKKKSIHH